MTKELSRFLQGANNPPSLPAVYYELVQVAERMHATVSDIGQIILKDQGVASRLLRLANSAFYGFPTQIGTIDEAIQLIGVIQIRDLVLATSVIKAFAGLPDDLVNVRSFWEHSIASGVACALLAERRQDPLPERLFVAGLLHDIGRLMMFLQAPDLSTQVVTRCEKEELLATQVERAVFGFDHAQLGAELISYWRLPGSLSEMVGRHHVPTAGSDSFIVHYADFITSSLQFGNSGELFVAPLVISPNRELPLPTNEELDQFIEELARRCEEMLPIFVQS